MTRSVKDEAEAFEAFVTAVSTFLGENGVSVDDFDDEDFRTTVTDCFESEMTVEDAADYLRAGLDEPTADEPEAVEPEAVEPTAEKQAIRAEKAADTRNAMERAAAGIGWQRDSLLQPYQADMDKAKLVEVLPAEREAILNMAQDSDISLFARLCHLGFNAAVVIRQGLVEEGSNEVSPMQIFPKVRDWFGQALLYGWKLDDKTGALVPETLGRDRRLPTLDMYLPVAAKCSILAMEGYIQLSPWHVRLDRVLSEDERQTTTSPVAYVPTYKRGVVASVMVDHDATERTNPRRVVYQPLTTAQAEQPYRASLEAIRQLWLVFVEGPSKGTRHHFTARGEFTTGETREKKGAGGTTSKSTKVDSAGITDVLKRVSEVLDNEAKTGESASLNPEGEEYAMRAAASVIHNRPIEEARGGVLEAFFALAYEVNTALGMERLGNGYREYVERQKREANKLDVVIKQKSQAKSA